MQKWKRLTEKKQDPNRSYSSTKYQRYTSKKVSNDELNTSKFHNSTFDKI